MDFNDFLDALGELKQAGWAHSIQEVPCLNGFTDHTHLAIRLQSPEENGWIDPVAAVCKARAGGVEGELHYKDSAISLSGIRKACDTLDWLRSGLPSYAGARLDMIMELGIAVEEVQKLAPKPRQANTVSTL